MASQSVSMLDVPEDLTDDEAEAKVAKAELKANLMHHRCSLSYLRTSVDKGEDKDKSKKGKGKEKEKENEKSKEGSEAAAEPLGYAYPCLCRRVRVEATTRRYEAWEKKMGKMYWVSRNVFVPSYEYLEVTLSNRQKTWMGKILYDSHNVSRVRATTDDTWELDKFMDSMQKIIQHPAKVPGSTFNITESPLPDGPGGKTRLQLQVKEKTGGRTIVYCQPLELSEVEPGIRTPAEFVRDTYAINLEALCRYCRVGKTTKANQLITEGFVDVHAFPGGAQHEGWCALQCAADRGQRKTLLWLLDEQNVDPFSRSKDGWTAMHCASKNGHFEVCKVLYERGASLHDETAPDGRGLTPVILMMENHHSGMLRYFLNEQSRFAKECYKAQGVRNKEMPPDMYLTLKPLPPELMKEIRRAKRIKRQQLDEARERRRCEEAGLPAPEAEPPKGRQRSSASSKGGASSSSKRGGGKASPSPSPSPTRQGSTGSTRQEKGQVSPASSVGSQKSGKSSPSPPKGRK